MEMTSRERIRLTTETVEETDEWIVQRGAASAGGDAMSW